MRTPAGRGAAVSNPAPHVRPTGATHENPTRLVGDPRAAEVEV